MTTKLSRVLRAAPRASFWLSLALTVTAQPTATIRQNHQRPVFHPFLPTVSIFMMSSSSAEKGLQDGEQLKVPAGQGLHRSKSGMDQQSQYNATAPLTVRQRSSHDEIGLSRNQFVLDIAATKKELLSQEDTDSNHQITADDGGPKIFTLKDATSNGVKQMDIRGTYQLANLLQELIRAEEKGQKHLTVDLDILDENPVTRLSRQIKEIFWNNLTRRLDASMIKIAATDTKDWTENPQPRIYVPAGEKEQYEYYLKIAKEQPDINLDVQLLPGEITTELYREINKKPGLLALAMEEYINDIGEKDLRGQPFVVPGGRFNELYDWDSYFVALGLLKTGHVHLAKGIVENFLFEIKNYGLIPNANRSYYSLRSQPPFLTNLALRVYDGIAQENGSKDFLRRAILAAIKEYKQVWMSEPRFDPVSGLSRYRPEGSGVPLECEEGHFNHILAPYAEKRGMTIKDFTDEYNSGKLDEPELDIYFMHDRAVRESGHDVSTRLEFVCADMATVDLNCLLYKYETDIAFAIRTYFDDKLVVPEEFCSPGQQPNSVEMSSSWDRKAKQRKALINQHMWNESEGLYFDYNTETKKQHTYETVTTFWTLWSGVATPAQATLLVSKALPKFECPGGLSVGTVDMRDKTTCHESHQWDYPYAWAPHQVLAWEGLRKYGYNQEAERLAYRWLYTITKVFFEYSAVVEKYDVTNLKDPHKVNAEYGNQGLDFSGYAKEGFGWTNASYVVGLDFLNTHQKRALGVLATWDAYEKGDQF